ncbi:MAG: M20/M25/M40 family metallo-hydrolase [Rhodothalassiaceae bacterium]
MIGARRFLALACLIVTSPCAAAPPLAPEVMRQAAEAAAPDALALFRSYLRLPNDSHKPEQIAPLAVWVEQAFQARGFTTKRLAEPDNPLILAERQSPGATRTALIYLQADGQPVDPAAWNQDSPFEPVLKRKTAAGWQPISWDRLNGTYDPDWRIFARSASDSKGPNIQFLTALDILQARGITPDFHLKVVIDTEEELGSPHLPQAVADHRDALAADFLYIFDGPPHPSGRPTLTFGARGIATVTLTTYGPKLPQHSGHYGNYAPNPAFHLARILASMKSADGRVTIPGYYDGITLDEDVRSVLEAVPDDEPAIRAALGFKTPDAVADSLQAARQFPSLNIRGLKSAWVGAEVRTVIPATAVAELDIRLVKESDPQRLIGLVRDHIDGLGYHVLDHAPDAAERAAHAHLVQMQSRIAYPAYRSPMDSLAGRTARAALTHLNGTEPILIRTSGGSIPISPFVETLAIPAVSVPTVNQDNNQHSPNENIRLGNFIDGIATILAVLAQPLQEEDS